MSEERDRPEPVETDDLDDDLLDDDIDEADSSEELEEPEAPEPEAAEPEAAPEPRRLSREQRRIRSLRAREREAREETRRLREERDRLLAQSRIPQAPPPDPYRAAEQARLEAERLSMMAPHEVAAYHADKVRAEFQQQMLRDSLGTRDLLDRQLFQNLARDEPAAKRLSAQVEDTLTQARNQGMNPTREAIYNLLIGQEVRAKAARQTERQRQAGRRRIANQTTRPGQGRSTAASPRANGGRAADDSDAALIARLKSVTLGDW